MLGLKILLADDEDYILRVVAFKLRGAGYRVSTAPCGQSALELAHAEQPDLIITDHQMPGLTGLELCRTLQCEAVSSGKPAIPVILLTARAHDIELVNAEPPANLRRVISKPFSPRLLVVTVGEILTETAEAA